MSRSLPPRIVRSLPLRANLEWLKKLSKERLAALRLREPDSQLSDAQLEVAREYGFASWRQLQAHVEDVRAKLDALVPADVRRRAAEDHVAANDPDLAKLFAAVAAGKPELVAELVGRRPALAAARDADGETPLHAAARFDDSQLAALLVAHGADVNAKLGQSGHTAISWAVTCHALDCARTLLKLGAEADLFCAAGIGALAEIESWFDAKGDLVPGASTTGSSRVAADGSRLPCPPSMAREQISDALYMACRNRQLEVARFLLGKGADLSFRAYIGGTPLHWAYFGGSRPIIEMLLEAGADPSARDDVLNCTPRAFGIATVANWGFDFKVKSLLADDPSLVNAVDSHTSPLHQAARGGHARVVRLLLDHGADVSWRDAAGKTALDVATEKCHVEVVAMLKAAAS
jgi:ankyrin repeat protein